MTSDSPIDEGLGRSAPSGHVTQDDLDVGLHRIVGPDGAYDPGDVPDLDAEQLRDIYRWMLTERTFSRRMTKLQRRGQLGTFASGRGQEGSIVGAGYAIDDDDWLMVGRGWTALFMQGVSMRDMILYWRGIEDASKRFARNRCMVAISIGSHLPLLNGLAWGMSLDDAETVATAFFGDGATSTGSVHEAINFAGAMEMPALLFCQNNQYAISTSFAQQTRAKSIAQRALGYGIDGVRVDGMDPLAVYDAVSWAREKVLAGEPVLVESVTYRWDAHTTSDDPSRYRTDEEVAEWKDKDPLERYRSFLEAEGLWSEIDHDAIVAEIDAEFDAALEAANAFEERGVEEIFAYVHDELPPALADQLAAFEQFLEERPDADDYIDQRPKQ